MDKKVPTLANCKRSSTAGSPASQAAVMVMDLLINPLNSGTPAMEKAAMVKHTHTKGIFFIQAAELVNFSDPCRIKDGARTHKQQGFIQDMAERVSCSTVQRKRCADADTRHHKADLADNMVREKPAHIVFQ